MSKLISTKKNYLIIYETKEAARVANTDSLSLAVVGAVYAGTGDVAAMFMASRSSDHWSKKFNCQVWYSKPDDVFMVLEEDQKNCLLKVLHSERVGWIFNYDWFGLKEIPHE